MLDSENVLSGLKSGVLTITLNHPKANALTNTPNSAQQALELGFVNRLAPTESINLQAEEWAQEIARGPVGLAKRVFNKAYFANLEQVLDYEARIQDIARSGEEFNEGLQTFMEKRQPNFL